MISFYKYHGAGNDFIVIDDSMMAFDVKNSELIKRMCDRHFGIGADGLMLLRPDDNFDFRMEYFNSDGHLGSMCGNGGRCIVSVANRLGYIGLDTTFIASDGKHKANILRPDLVSLEMVDVNKIESLGPKAILMDTGSPHYVALVHDVDSMDLISEGRKIRNSERFKKDGVNVNFVQLIEGGIKVRTYERGVEDETLSCGTGVTASALAAHQWGCLQSPIQVYAVGGRLEISFNGMDKGYKNIWKTGPTKLVFEGRFDPNY